MVSFNIDEFLGKMTTGLLRSNKFSLELATLPHGMAGSEHAQLFPDLKFYCESVDIPGVLLQTNEVKRYGYGPVEKKPYMPAFADARCVFRSDQEGKVFAFIRQWQALALNYEFPSASSNGGGIRDKKGYTNRSTGLGGTSRPELTPYELGYKRQYAVDVYITNYSEDGQAVGELTLRDAFPSLVADMPLAWAMTKAYAQLPVALTFTDVNYTMIPRVPRA